MAQLVVSAAGAVVGGMIGGPTGAQIGWGLGSAIGGAMFSETQKSSGPRLGDLSVMGSTYGSVIPYVQGRARIAGQVIWASSKREIASTQTAGGKGGPPKQEYTTYTYEMDMLILLSDNVLNVNTGNVWANGDLVGSFGYGSTIYSRATLYTGGPTQQPDPVYEAAVGSVCPAYRGRGTIFIQNLQLGSSGQVPNLTFEIFQTTTTVSGTPSAPLFSAYDDLSQNDYAGGGYVSGVIHMLDPTAVYAYQYKALYDVGFFVTSWKFNIDGSNTKQKLLTQNCGFDAPYPAGKKEYGNMRPATGLVRHYLIWSAIYESGGLLYRTRTTNEYRLYIEDRFMYEFSDFTPGTTGFTTNFFHNPATHLVNDRLYMYDIEVHTQGGQVYGLRIGYHDIGTRIVSRSVLIGPGTFSVSTKMTGIALVNGVLLCHICEYPLQKNYLYTLDPHTLEILKTEVLSITQHTHMIVTRDNSIYFFESGATVSSNILYYYDTSIGLKLINGALRSNTLGLTDVSASGSGGSSRIYYSNIFILNNEAYAMWATTTTSGTRIIAKSSPALTVSTLTLQSCVNSLCLRAGLLASQFDATALSSITKPVYSLVLSSISNIRTIIEMLMDTYYFDIKISDKLYFIPRSTKTSVATIPFNSLIRVDTKEIFYIEKINDIEISSQVSLTYTNIQDGYKPDTQNSDRLFTSQVSTSAIQLALGFNPSEAKDIANAILYKKATSNLRTTIILGPEYLKLEIGDIITIIGEDSISHKFIIVKTLEELNNTIRLDLESVDMSIYTQTGITSSTVVNPGIINYIPSTTLAVLDIPILRDVDNTTGIYLAVSGGTTWSQAGLYESTDTTYYTNIANISSKTVIGNTVTTLGTWNLVDQIDYTNTVTVVVEPGNTLYSTTRDELLKSKSINLALIGGELLQFIDATLISLNTYQLSNFYRARQGTGSASSTHKDGEVFVLLDNSGLVFINKDIAALNKDVYYKAVSLRQKLTDVQSSKLNFKSTNIKPLASVDARANRNTTDTVITWKRVTRLTTSFNTFIVPQDDTSELYDVEIYTTSDFTTVKRTFSSLTTPTVTYTSAQQVTDFGSNQTVLYIKIYKFSLIVGRGYPLIATI